jgi:hypothetical protein
VPEFGSCLGARPNDGRSLAPAVAFEGPVDSAIWYRSFFLAELGVTTGGVLNQLLRQPNSRTAVTVASSKANKRPRKHRFTSGGWLSARQRGTG